MQFEYSTSLVDASMRNEYWNEVICRHFIPSRCSIDVSSPSIGTYRGHTLGPLTAAQGRAPSRSWTRTQEIVRRAPDHDFLLIGIGQGQARMEQGGRQTLLNEGDIALYDAGRPFVHEFSEGASYALRIPRSLMTSRFGAAESLINHKLCEKQAMAGLLLQMMHGACGSMWSTTEAAKTRFASAILDALAAAMEVQAEDQGVRQIGLENGLYGKALRYIDAHYEDADITSDDIADGLHVSRRTLSRAFARQDTTLMQQLWRKRLEVSYMLLAEGKVCQINQAAYQCGFTDLSHYCRAFKTMYSVSPSSVLKKT